MSKLKETSLFCSLILVLTLLTGTAFAGPVLTFGPDDEGLIKFEYKGQFSLTARDTGTGADRDENTYTFNFRRQRFAIMGAYGDNFSLYVNTDYSEDNDMIAFTVTDGGDDSFRVIDAVFRYSLNDPFKFWAGKFKYSLTRENLEACEKPLTHRMAEPLPDSKHRRVPGRSAGTTSGPARELWSEEISTVMSMPAGMAMSINEVIMAGRKTAAAAGRT